MVADTCTFRNRRHALQRRLPLLCAKGVGIIALLASGSDALACPPVSFGPHVDYATGGYSISVAVADLNRDGKPDVVTANLLSDSVSVLLGKGDGTFQPKVDYATGSWPPSVAVADLNRDGKPDLVTANISSVSVLLGKGDGTFQPGMVYANGDGDTYSVAVADLNRDGKPDVVTANGFIDDYSGSVSVLLNTGP